ncbi:hypothetical protein O3G_MSEX014972 [Manduca sexta]|uniref:Glycosyltransferase family 92 protein n=1 Tax=Manduca sexta TaxID=7130 RepID=A0A922CZ88_MANSE|nr:hypothetical protein O3G_MSEX014972 [Manduca sexta]
MLSEILRNTSMEVRETPPLFQQIDENFYSYSSFLRSYQKYDKLTQSHAHSVDTIVIGKTQVRPNFRCNIWLEDSNKPKAGRFSFKMISDSTGEYQLYVFKCILSKNLGKPIGVSFYMNDYTVNPINAPINRLIEVNTKRVMRESGSVKFVNNIEPAICVIPNQVPLVSRDAFIEFLVFHHMMGVDYYTIYDSMISEDIIRRLNLLPSDITQWRIQFFPLNFPFIFSKSYNIVRQAVELDCLFRHFRLDKEETNKASHVMVMSWDEFLVPRVHGNVKEVVDDLDPTRKLASLEVTQLLFCLNQEDDSDVEDGYPDIIKKTHYYMLKQDTKPVFIRNLDSMTTFDDILDFRSNKNISLDILGAHKYTECRDPKVYRTNGEGYNMTQMNVFQHKFEGAMTRFRQQLVSNKIYRLYRSGQIWEKNSQELVRDL